MNDFLSDILKHTPVSVIQDNALSHGSPKRTTPRKLCCRSSPSTDRRLLLPMRKPDLEPPRCRWESMPTKATSRWQSSGASHNAESNRHDTSPVLSRTAKRTRSTRTEKPSHDEKRTPISMEEKHEALMVVTGILEHLGDSTINDIFDHEFYTTVDISFFG